MRPLSLLLRGVAFWLGAFYAFGLAWAPLRLNILPSDLSAAVMVSPVIALILGALIPNKVLLASSKSKILLFVILLVGIIGCAVVAIDDLSAPEGANMAGFWFRIIVAIVLMTLLSRYRLARQQDKA
jgi:hypothetical protein